MKLSDAYTLAIRLLKKQAMEKPSSGFKDSDGDRVTIMDVAEALEKVHKWIHPGLYSENITQVVYCKECKHYKKYKKKGALKSGTFHACELDMSHRDPMFFCKEGITKED